jgi:hypothetical protein
MTAATSYQGSLAFQRKQFQRVHTLPKIWRKDTNLKREPNLSGG